MRTLNTDYSGVLNPTSQRFQTTDMVITQQTSSSSLTDSIINRCAERPLPNISLQSETTKVSPNEVSQLMLKRFVEFVTLKYARIRKISTTKNSQHL